jgi:hypothetical protein
MFHNGWWDCLAVIVDRYRNTYVYNYMYEFLKFVLCIYGLMCLVDDPSPASPQTREPKYKHISTLITNYYVLRHSILQIQIQITRS